MGCCNSKASEDQRQDICVKMAKEMMLISVPVVLKKPEDIKIPLPDAFADLKKASTALREQAKQATGEKKEEGGEASNAEPVAEKKSSMMDAAAGLLGKAVGVVQQGVEVACEVAAEGVAKGFELAADALDLPIKAVEDRLSLVAKEILSSEDGFTKVSKVFSNHIVMAAVQGAEDKCKGIPNKRAISEYLINKAEAHLVTQLMTEIDDALKTSAGITAWNDAIENYNKACAKISAVTSQVVLPTISLDIKEYICRCTVQSLNDLLGKQEEEIRADPAGKAPATTDHRDVFIRTFTDTAMLTKDDWKKVGGMPA